MWRSVTRGRLWVAVSAVILASSCRAGDGPPVLPPPEPPLVAGTLTLTGLAMPVAVARDRAGIAHITAGSPDDLFFAQGFVQAQDRLFQMDLWRRSVQGRLSEVLGANFMQRDTMTRRIQYRGDRAADWASYGPETERIVTAFVRGINAWVARARTNPPEEFRLAGWLPEAWSPEDLLNRTDAFLSANSGRDELLRARLVAVLGASRVDAILPPGPGLRTVAPPELDLGSIGFVVGDMLRRVGTRPFFAGLAGAVRETRDPDRGPRGAGSNAWVIAGARTASGYPIVAADPHRSFDNPSLRYLVHLTAPGWNVIGATAPWLPGVAIGHNEQVAWGMAAADADVQDLYVERLDPADERRVDDGGRFVPMTIEADAIVIKGRKEPWEFERQYTPRGAVIGVDRERHLAYVLRWTGTDPGTASELAALELDRAASAAGVAAALARWKSPVADFVYAARDGTIGARRAGLTPVRRGANGLLPAPAWRAVRDWTGSSPADPPRRASGPGDPFIVFANGSEARTGRIRELVGAGPQHTVERSRALQHDTVAWNAVRLIPLLASLRGATPAAEALRARLLAWDRRVVPQSEDAAAYVAWEGTLRRLLAAGRVPPEFAGEVARLLPLVTVLTGPSADWFDGRPTARRDALLLEALSSVASEPPHPGREVTFAHPLGVGEAGRRRFDVGPFPLPGYSDTVFATSADGQIGPSFRVVFDLADWDRSVATSAPGQSGRADSPHFSDLAKLWAAGDYFALPFSEPAVKANTESVLTLTPVP